MSRLVVLGSGTAIPTERRASPGLLLETGEGGAVLIDPGPGTLCRMAAQGVQVEDVDRVLITHHHPDHTLDIMALLFARRNPWLEPRLRKLRLVGPPGTRDLYARMKNLYGAWGHSKKELLEIIEGREGPLPSSSGLSGTAYALDHTEISLGYRLDLTTGVLALSGDTGPCDALEALGRNADLFLLECAIPDTFPAMPGHMKPADAGRAASRAAPKKLVLYHLYPPVDAEKALVSVRRFYRGETSVAEDGSAFVL